MGLGDEIKSAVNWDAPIVDINDSLRVVIQKMVDSKTSALVVKSGDDVIGVITDMDLIGSIDRSDDLDETRVPSFMTACELMTGETVKSPCVQLDATQSVEHALGVMNVAGVHNLLIAGESDKYVGVVSIVDLLKLAIA